MNKNELRLKMKAVRRSLTDEEISAKSENIISRFIMLEEYKKARELSVYMSAFKEPDTLPLIMHSMDLNKKIAVPVSNTDTRTLTLAYLGDNANLKKGAYGISEPELIIAADKNDIDIIAVPGLAFDKTGNRLGFGMGYYDNLLADMSAVKVGFCYDFQLMELLPAEEHDISMDIIITETKIIYRR